MGGLGLVLVTATTLLAASGTATAAAMQKQLNLTISSYSPMLQYIPGLGMLPNQSLDATVSWNATFSNTPYATWTNDRIGRGDSRHTTSKPGASVDFSWVGTAVYFFGTTNGTIELDIDGAIPSLVVSRPAENLLASTSGLDYGYHTAKLILSSGTVSLSNVTFTTGLKTEAASGAQAPMDTMQGAAGTHLNVNPDIDNRQAKDQRQWNAHPDFGTPDDSIIYTRIDTQEKGSYIRFAVPPKTSLVTLWGSVGANHGRFTVNIDPMPPHSTIPNVTMTGYSPFSIPNTMMYTAPLDPAELYNITLVNADDKWFDFANATFYNSTIPVPAGLSSGAIAGTVIGTLLGVVVIAVVVFFVIRHRNATTYSEVIDDEMAEVGIISPRLREAAAQPLHSSFGMALQPLQTDHARSASVRSRASHVSHMSHGTSITAASSTGSAISHAAHGYGGYLHRQPSSCTTSPSEYLSTENSLSPGGMGRVADMLRGDVGGEEMPSLTSASMQMKREILAGGGRLGPMPGFAGGEVYMMDTDAGPAHAPEPRVQVQLMPPSYNPAWANAADEVMGPSSSTAEQGHAGHQRPLLTPDSSPQAPFATLRHPPAAVTRLHRSSTYKPPIHIPQ